MNKTIKAYNQAINLDIDKLVGAPHFKFVNIIRDRLLTNIDYTHNLSVDISGYSLNFNYQPNKRYVKLIPLSDFLISTIDDVVREIWNISNDFLDEDGYYILYGDSFDNTLKLETIISRKLYKALKSQNLDNIQQYMNDIILLLKK